MRTKDEELLADFTAYCKDHPNERFWQALRNWSEWPYVLVATSKSPRADVIDTFYWEGRSG